MTTASARLRQKPELIAPAFDTPGRLLWSTPTRASSIRSTWRPSSYVTLAMIPLMEAALERARVLAQDDPVAAALADYLERHIPEEIHGEEPGRRARRPGGGRSRHRRTSRRPLQPKIAGSSGVSFSGSGNATRSRSSGSSRWRLSIRMLRRSRADRADGPAPRRLPPAAPTCRARRRARRELHRVIDSLRSSRSTSSSSRRVRSRRWRPNRRVARHRRPRAPVAAVS